MEIAMPDFITSFLLFILVLSSYVYIKLKQKYSYWQKRGYPFIKPHIIFGNLKQVILRKVYSGEEYKKLYNTFKRTKVGGFYRFFVPSILVTDPDIIKMCLTKEFESFNSRGTEGKVKHEPIRCHLINLENEKWRKLKRCLTPAFTINKIKNMTPMMYECGLQMIDVLDEKLQTSDDIQLQDITTRYSIDVIGTCAFGLKLKSLTDEDSKFRCMGKQIFRLSKLSILKAIISIVAPNVYNFLRLRLVSKEVTNFFTNLVQDIVTYREEHGIVRNDFLDLLIQLKHKEIHNKENEKIQNGSLNKKIHLNGKTNCDNNNRHIDFEINTNIMVAQCFVFFIAGYETSSATLNFCLYELALNPQMQSKLQEEIDRVIENNSRSVTFQAVQEMHYLDKVVLETLRKYPPIGAIVRKCNKQIRIPDTNLTIEPNERIVISSYAIHHDPEIYPNPDIFDPERFSESNKALRHHFTYLPFGEGPRGCIGRCFGSIQVKIGLICLLSRYSFRVSSKTIIPVQLDPKSTIISSKGGITLSVQKRS